MSEKEEVTKVIATTENDEDENTVSNLVFSSVFEALNDDFMDDLVSNCSGIRDKTEALRIITEITNTIVKLEESERAKH